MSFYTPWKYSQQKVSMKQFNLNIQGMRGICAMMVFWGHVLMAYNIGWIQDNQHNPLFILMDGRAAVVFFFMLSGYFYYSPNVTCRKYVSTIIKRVVRITPPYLLTILVGAILCNLYLNRAYSPCALATGWFVDFWNEPVSLVDFLKNVNIMFWQGESKDLINPVSWYLKVDLRMMLELPVIIFVLNKTRWWLAPIFIVFCFVTFYNLTLATFLLGATIHRYQDTLVPILSKSRIVVGVLVIAGLYLWDMPNMPFVEHYIDKGDNVSALFRTLGVAMILMVVLTKSSISALSSKLLQYLGKISYEFYIVHFIVLLGLAPFINNTILFICLSLCLSLLASIVVQNANNRLSRKILTLTL